jgi:hypothetical protein
MRRVVVALLLSAGCMALPARPVPDTGLDELALEAVHPAVLLPGTRIDLVGSGFADATRGASRLRFAGTFTPKGGTPEDIELAIEAYYDSSKRMHGSVSDALLAALPAREGTLDADASVLVDSVVDRHTHSSPPVHVTLTLAQTLVPRASALSGGSIHVNDVLELAGDGLLLGGGEGETHALFTGCFLPSGAAQPCKTNGTSVTNIDLVTRPSVGDPWSRQKRSLPFAPEIAGIRPGTWTGTVTVENRQQGRSAVLAGALPLTVTLKKPAVRAVAPAAVSVGQYVFIDGGGFVGEAGDEVTLLRLSGTFLAAGASTSAPVDIKLVPKVLSGTRARYVLDEADALGQLVDLRKVSGSFTGKVIPIVRKGASEIEGDGASLTLQVSPVKQVVYVRFLPSYVDGLRLFGMLAADADIRRRALEVAARDYDGVNIEFRDQQPEDFAVYAQVDISGADPNGRNLLGYDNTTGKDVGNRRLFDRIGGVNATTQSDGFPGYGGIFTEQLLGFSEHPPAQVTRLPSGANAFDAIFDRVRPETGVPIGWAEARAGIAALADGVACPADSRDRSAAVACAVFVLGNLLGTTLSHEVGHSLGLADPTGDRFHNAGDEPNRLMDAGDARTFEERAELLGQGPAVFCQDDISYLREILPGAISSSAFKSIARPPCD